jgi:hypothetical protein
MAAQRLSHKRILIFFWNNRLSATDLKNIALYALQLIIVGYLEGVLLWCQ